MTAIENALEKIDGRFGDEATKSALAEIQKVHDAPEDFMDRVVTFANVLKAGKYKATDYVKAVQYTSYRAMDMTMKQAFMQTYPNRCFRDGVRKPEGTIEALSSLYDKTKLVQSILGQMQIPLHLMMMGERVKAANVLAQLMMDEDQAPRIRMESADKLLNHIQVPEAVKFELDVSVKADETLQDINQSLDALAKFAQAKITRGDITPVEVIES